MLVMALAPIAAVVAAMIGFAACKAGGIDPHLPAMLIAVGGTIAASVLAAIPSVLSRRASQVAITQAALMGTMIHLFVAAVVAVVVLLQHLRFATAFLYWMLPLYWVTLIVLVIALTRAVRTASADPGH